MDKNINKLGENYRKSAFLDDGKNTIGCYTTFIVAPEFRKLKHTSRKFQRVANILLFGNDTSTLSDVDEVDLLYLYKEYEYIKEYDNIYYNKREDILMGFFWNGDGSIVFKQGSTIVFNDDCKKDYNWKLIKN